MSIFAVIYQYDSSTEEARSSVRPTHRAWLGELAERKIVLSSGPYVDGSGALLLFESDSAQELEQLLDQDPFAQAKLIASREAHEWTPALGAFSPQG